MARIFVCMYVYWDPYKQKLKSIINNCGVGSRPSTVSLVNWKWVAEQWLHIIIMKFGWNRKKTVEGKVFWNFVPLDSTLRKMKTRLLKVVHCTIMQHTRHAPPNGNMQGYLLLALLLLLLAFIWQVEPINWIPSWQRFTLLWLSASRVTCFSISLFSWPLVWFYMASFSLRSIVLLV